MRCVKAWMLGMAACLIAIAPALCTDMLVTTDGTRHYGAVSQEGETYILVTVNNQKLTFPAKQVRAVMRDVQAPSPAERAGEALEKDPRLATMRLKVQKAVEAATAQVRRVRQSHESERQAAVPAELRQLEAAKRELDTVTASVENMRKYGIASATEHLGYYKGQSGVTRQITREGEEKRLEEAKAAYAEAQKKAQGKSAAPPPELLARQRKEVAEYAALDQLCAKARMAASDGLKALQAAASDQGRLEQQWPRLEKQVDEAVEGLYAELNAIRVRHGLPPLVRPTPAAPAAPDKRAA